ncbi:MAG TPA: ester cyclase [Vicinamibacterales bacterium]
MTRDDILALLVRRTAAWKARDAPALAAMHAHSGVVASPAGGVLEGRQEIERVSRLWFAAFPDLITTEDAVLVDGNQAVQIFRFSGTHAGEFFGLPATGRHVEVAMASLLTLRDGFITEERRIYDFTGVLVQVGVLKAKPQF